MAFVVQHPYGESDEDKLEEAGATGMALAVGRLEGVCVEVVMGDEFRI